ncbi:MAG: SDR family oxidoreductase [Chloroflexota bacterium]|nr:SDR family oxidoreductase [Chloroflexota bacterium]
MATGKLTGKIAIVTGSDSGIGQAIAEEFARHGADVAVTWFHDEAGARQTAESVHKAGRTALVTHLDVRDPAAVATLFADVEAQLGVPFILVNDAGIDAVGKDVAEMAIEEWEDRFRSNVHGPFYACQQFIRARRRAGGGGKIINITSVHEDIPRAGAAGYCASKGALRHLTRCLALELAGDRINVNNIAPGMVKTSMNQPALDDPKVMEEQVQSIPLKRAAEPEEIAHLALYLASSDSDYASGQTYVLDGGLMMNQGQGA